YDQQVAHTAALRDMLTAEMTARVAPAAESASWHRGDFAYFTRNMAGLEYEQFCRRPAHGAAGAGSQQAGGPPAEVLLDPNILLETESRDTTETLAIPATDPGAAPAVLQERRKGVEYWADHADGPAGGEFYLVTNDGAADFRLVRGPARRPAGWAGWTEVIAGADGTRLVSCNVFGRFVVVEQRREAATQLRVIDRETGAERRIEAAGPEVALALAVNEDYRATAVT